MRDIVIDTNVVIWYFGDYSRLSPDAEKTIDDVVESGTVFVSSITIVELTYLLEKNRIPVEVMDKLREALDDESTSFRLAELNRLVAEDIQRIDRSIVGDMPDRIIAATALHLDLPLLTSDGNIHKLTNVETIW
jgi:PIN domain nuclease of toxin-antitoxin system